MAWDTERTKQLLLDAATVEFSARGLAGARVDRIAAQAGVNKERIYSYFGGKEELFGAVLQRELALAMETFAIAGTGPEAVAAYAGRMFDYQGEHPHLARLTFWEGLELAEPVALELRRAGVDAKVAGVRAAMPELSEAEARELLLTILTLCDGYHVLRNIEVINHGAAAASPARRADRRAAIVAAVLAA
ncbi:MAG: TetR family transcriptional regulator, partial [Microbacteriaceae bacterium]|nr:TetR family transcriptional regulator [Microbacteriaceae bacterium]